MRKAVNIIFVILVGAFLCGALAFQVADKVVPSFEAPKSSELEGREYVQFSDVLGKSIRRGVFQDQFEQYAADSMPARETLVALSAALQRQGIVTANVPFGYGVYPTFFASEYCAVPEDGIITCLPMKKPEDDSAAIERIDAWTRTLSNAAANHPETRFVVNVALQIRHDDSNPAYDYVTSFDKIDANWVREVWTKNLSEGIDFILDDVADAEEVRDGWFATDHHWKLEQALETYNDIAQRLGLRHVAWGDAPVVEVVPSWQGSLARRGLISDYADSIVDQTDDFSQLTYKAYKGKKAGKVIKDGKREAILAGTRDASDVNPNDAYSEYYGDKQALIENAGQNNGKTCLLVGDSLSYILRRYIAANYKTTICVHPGNSKVDRTLESFIDEYGVDDVIVLTHARSSDFIAEKSPKFLYGE